MHSTFVKRPNYVKRSIAFGALTALVLFTGCLKDDNANKTTGPANVAVDGTKKYRVRFAQANSKDPYRQVQNAAITKAAKDYPDIDFAIDDATNDDQTQIGQVETLLTQKIDLLLISPNEADPLTPVVGKVFDAHIPVILMERGIKSDKYTSWLGGDNKEIGNEAGKFIVEKSGGKGRIIEIYGKEAATPTKERHQGFADAIAGSPGLTVVDHYVCNYEREPARSYIENVLQKHTDFNIIYAHNDEMALGAVLALKAAGKDPKNYIIVGIDGVQKEVVQAIKAGDMTATFKYNWLGKEAIDTAHKILKGEKVDRRIILPTERVTAENADAYLASLPSAH